MTKFFGLEQENKSFWCDTGFVCQVVVNYSKHLKGILCGSREPQLISDVRLRYTAVFIHSYGFWLSSSEDHWVSKVTWLWSKSTKHFLASKTEIK